MRLRSPTAEIVIGAESGGPWSMTICPSEPEKAVSGVRRRPFTAIPSAPLAKSRLTTSWTSWKFDQVARRGTRAGSRHAVAQGDLDPGSMHRYQAGVRAEIGNLVFQRLRRGRSPRRLRLERVDLGAQLGDLAAVRGVGRLELLDAPDEGLVPGHLVGGGQELRPDLVGEHEPGDEGDEGHEAQAGQPAGGHGSRFGSICSPRPRESYYRKPSHGGRNPRFRLPDRTASLRRRRGPHRPIR